MNIFACTNKKLDKILKELKTSRKGLSNDTAKKRLAEYGLNATSIHSAGGWNILWRQFTSPFIYLLIIASAIAWLLGQPLDGLVILAFVFINAFLGFYQEYRSEKALRLLQHYIVSESKVIRAGKKIQIEVSQLVPGDVVVLETGDKVPADMRIFESEDLIVDESCLTGESAGIKKNHQTARKAATSIFESKNIVFTGTHVLSGTATGIVVATGGQTQFGKITKLTLETVKESIFAKGVGRLSKFILRLIIVTLVFIFLANILIKGGRVDIGELIIFSIALAVSVIPEALPVVITLSLSRGALRLAKKKVVAKRLGAIEDLGGIQVLCTDKTGTLTENNMRVADLCPGSAEETLLYANLGVNQLTGGKLFAFDLALNKVLLGNQKESLKQFKLINELPFDPRTRLSCTLVENKKGTRELVVKGAPEALLNICVNVNCHKIKTINNWIYSTGKEGKRVLAVARKSVGPQTTNHLIHLIDGLSFVGAVSFVDPIKKTAHEVADKARELGIKIKILTGDSPQVAGSVAKSVGLIDSLDQVVIGDNLMKLSPAEQIQIIDESTVFARVSPEQKYNIINILQNKYQVGYIGDGINDAPALKTAGVSMVVEGATDLARDAADLILLQKDLRVIIDGIKEGRQVFANTVKYIKSTITSNFGNFYAVAAVSLFIPFLPMLPMQILLLNLLSDFPMIAIATDTVAKADISKPQKYNLKEILLIASVLGAVSTIFDFIFFGMFYRFSPSVLQTNWFIGSILTELAFLFVIRTRGLFYQARRPPWTVIVLTSLATVITLVVPFTLFGQRVFHFTPPSATHLVLILGLVVLYFICSELVKIFYYHLSSNNQNLNKK